MITSTTHGIEGRRRAEYKGIVLGANAVIGIDLDYENISAGRNSLMLMASASGTAGSDWIVP